MGIISGVAALITWAGATVGVAVATATATAIATDLVVGLALMGLDYVVTAAFGPSAPKGPQPAGVQGQVKLGGNLPRAFVVGTYATAGSMVFAEGWGSDGTQTPNAYLTQVIALSDLPVDSLLEIWTGSNKSVWNPALTPTTAMGVPVVEYRDSTGVDYMWVKFYDGTQSSADSFLTSTFGGESEFPIDSAMVATGVSYIIVTTRFNTNMFSGFPTFKFALKGAKFYDIRLDSTAGGSGSHRFDDQTTWAWTDNPMVIEYNILRGITYGGVPLWGPQGISAYRLPTSSWVAAMNACDQTTTDSLGATVRQYRCGGEITVDMQPVDVMDALNQTCNARVAEVGGIYKPLVGGTGMSVMNMSDTDLIISQPATFDMFPSTATLVNGISASYPEPTENWTTKDAPPINNTTYEAADGKVLSSSVNYGMVPYASQVQQLMSSALDESRKFRKHTVALSPKFWALEPTDIVTWTSPKNGYSSKTFMVLAITDMHNLDVIAVLGETDPSDYSFDTGTDYQPNVITAPVFTLPIILPPDPATILLREQQQALDDIAAALIAVSAALQQTGLNAAAFTTTATQRLEQTIIANQSATASAITDLQAVLNIAGVDVLAASLEQGEQIAKVSADGALASDITNLTTTVGGHTINIASQLSSINGIQANWGVTITSGNRITGAVRLDGGVNSSIFSVLASSFYIYDGSSDIPAFALDSGVLKLNVPLFANTIVANMIQTNQIQLTHMTSNSVDTAQLLSNAVTVSGSAVAGSDVPCDPSSPATTPATVATFTGTFTGDPIFIWVYLDMSIGGGGNHVFGINLYVNAGLIYSIPQVISILNSSRTPHMILVPHTPSSGSHTYAVAILSDSASTTAKAGSLLTIIQNKKDSYV